MGRGAPAGKEGGLLKSYVINLDRSAERLQHFLEQADNAHLQVTRVAAVDGGAMTAEERLAVSSRHPQFQPLNAGELGVFLSHRHVWRTLVESGDACAAIFEDDALLAADLGELLAGIDANPPQADVIKLETTLRPVALGGEGVALGGGYRGHRLASWHGGTAGYVITRACATRLLDLTDPVADTVDQVMFNPLSRISRTLDVVQVSPAPCVQFDILNRADKSGAFATTIKRRGHTGLFHYGMWGDLRRVLQRLAEQLLREFRGRMPGSRLQVVPFAGAGARAGSELQSGWSDG